MMYEVVSLLSIKNKVNEKLSRNDWKDMRNYADTTLSEKLYARAKTGWDTYKIETKKIPCLVGMLIDYLREQGYRAQIDYDKVLTISW